MGAVWALWSIYSIALLAASLIPGYSMPEVVLLTWDKLEHAVAFFGLAMLTAPLVIARREWPWILLGYAAIMAYATEAIQMLSPGRLFSYWDMLADMVGTVVMVGIVALVVLAAGRERIVRLRVGRQDSES
jgi:VanZ family protein